ncbi:hypothetical protein BUALT_Bualt07G0045100 [Buddleja alternifolia]|uniref:GTD-binding domain-containing protein n=1 Tax=Buddleja alternifolia TaxID=168488 RepID=A0AAV6X919_9LAMI|nr:hypothetical protein BUALT_Bualt07G0045100 [Buddleja alternifolia]
MPMGSFNTFVEQKLGKLPHFLIYAILEWIMIILLFIDGFIAFFSNEFAKFFELQIPCLLCTRIDHIFVHRTSNFYYNDSTCEVHKKDISTLAYCHVHKKLSDIRNMCQGCLLSFATEKDSDVDKYKSIVGILHKDVDSFVEEERKFFMKPLKKDGVVATYDVKSGIPRCSCCGEPSNSRSKYKRSSSMNAPTPSPRAPFYGSRNDGGNMDLPHIRYTELKLMSDTESEVPEDEDVPNGGNQSREDLKAATMPVLSYPDDINEDSPRTPNFTRGNKFFGIPLSDSAQSSPRWANRGTRKLPVDLVVDPTDTSGLTEGDGDILTRLKRQVRLDRRSLMALYMELDEERSASAVAANNAMAMITRLQAEKASVQMEALQYQRMMEEQAEYDQEALQVVKDLLFKREEDMKALESELETYREKYGVIKKVGSEICEVDFDDDYQDIESQALSSFGEKSDCGSLFGADQNENERPYERSREYGGGNVDESSLDFEGERSYLMSLLKNVEKNIDETSDSSEIGIIKHNNECRGNESKGILTREVSLIRERLRAIEADSGFLKHAAMTLQRGDEGTKLLTEIAEHLRKLRQPAKSPSEDPDP